MTRLRRLVAFAYRSGLFLIAMLSSTTSMISSVDQFFSEMRFMIGPPKGLKSMIILHGNPHVKPECAKNRVIEFCYRRDLRIPIFSSLAHEAGKSPPMKHRGFKAKRNPRFAGLAGQGENRKLKHPTLKKFDADTYFCENREVDDCCLSVHHSMNRCTSVIRGPNQ